MRIVYYMYMLIPEKNCLQLVTRNQNRMSHVLFFIDVTML